MQPMKTIAVVDYNKAILIAVRMLLEPRFRKVFTLSSPGLLMNTLREEKVDIVLLDMNFSAGINTGNEGLFWLAEIKKQYPSLPVVLFTAYADIGLAVRGIKEGAADFIVKPWDNARLIETLDKYSSPPLLHNNRAAGDVGEGMFWGYSGAMEELRLLIEKVARTDASILITGENGTGKEMLAREIHALSNRKEAPMVSVDMGAIAEPLF